MRTLWVWLWVCKCAGWAKWAEAWQKGRKCPDNFQPMLKISSSSTEVRNLLGFGRGREQNHSCWPSMVGVDRVCDLEVAEGLGRTEREPSCRWAKTRAWASNTLRDVLGGQYGEMKAKRKQRTGGAGQHEGDISLVASGRAATIRHSPPRTLALSAPPAAQPSAL